jgi:ParB-like chromosome segregation protein Spo0J
VSGVSFADFNFERLSPRSRETLERIAPLIDDAGRTDYAEVAAELGLATRQVRQALAELRDELEAQKAGAELPALTQVEFEGLRESISTYGQLVPIVRVNGDVVDGHHRERAVLELGKTPWYVDQAREDVTAHELELIANVVRRHLTTSQRRVAVEAELVHDPTRSDRSIATLFGMSPTTVGRIRLELEARGKVSRLDTRQDTQGRPVHVEPAEPRVRTIELNAGALESLTEYVTDIRDALHPEAALDSKQRAMALSALAELVDLLGLDVELELEGVLGSEGQLVA